MILAGTANFLLARIDPGVFDERLLLTAFAAVGLVSLVFVRGIGVDRYDSHARAPAGADWGRIARALVPSFIIAVGAGLTIQFMNLFFYAVFGLGFDQFSLLGAGASLLATLAVLGVPRIKARHGYRGSITVSQSLAVLALVGLATTEFAAPAPWALALAVFLYSIRQPLMNMANPMTTELTMYYVGEHNREMTSALTGAIWSGSWFFSALIFGLLRAREVPYAHIFYLTAALYAAGVYGFHLLIRAHAARDAGAPGDDIMA